MARVRSASRRCAWPILLQRGANMSWRRSFGTRFGCGAISRTRPLSLLERRPVPAGRVLDAVKSAIARLMQETNRLCPILLVGRRSGSMANCSINCAAVILSGQLLRIVPKPICPTTAEFYEKRQFTSGRTPARARFGCLADRSRSANDLIFHSANFEGLKLHVEICEDVWTPIPPSTYAALAGATVLANLSASTSR